MNVIDEFLIAASVPMQGSHVAGDLAEANAMLSSHPALASHSIHAAAALGDDAAVRRHLARDASLATARAGPRAWDPLTHLCFSRYLRLDAARCDGFVAAATALLDAGASPDTGWREADGTWESVLYGAAGVAHHETLTRLLLSRGADPNDGETPYHAPETRDNGAVRALLECGRLNAESRSWMLVRKSDWHDLDGLRLVLDHGAPVNHIPMWGISPLQHAVRRDNSAEMIALLLDRGADPGLVTDKYPLSAAALAARRGRADLLEVLHERNVRAEDLGAEPLLVACAFGALGAARAFSQQGQAQQQLDVEGGTILAEFAGNGNAAGVGCLLDLGVPVDARYVHGDGYFAIAPASTALHVAAWRGRHDVVRVLLERGADPVATDGWGRTPLQLAVRACVDSYWMDRRLPDSVAMLLAAGADRTGIAVPTGYAEIDALLG